MKKLDKRLTVPSQTRCRNPDWNSDASTPRDQLDVVAVSRTKPRWTIAEIRLFLSLLAYSHFFRLISLHNFRSCGAVILIEDDSVELTHLLVVKERSQKCKKGTTSRSPVCFNHYPVWNAIARQINYHLHRPHKLETDCHKYGHIFTQLRRPTLCK